MSFAAINRDRLIGRKIALARKNQKITQEELSQALSFKDRQTLSNIEKGSRRITAEELVVVMKRLDRTLKYFTDPYQLEEDQPFSWRTSDKQVATGYEPVARNIVATYKRLSDLTQGNRSFIIPQLAVSEKSDYDDISAIADSLAKEWWEADGAVPAKELLNKIINDLKVETFFLDMPDQISGSSVWVDDFCAIFVNRNHSLGRQAFSVAHELFHVLTWKTFHPAHFAPEEWDQVGVRSEKLANRFASALLLPSYILPELPRKQSKEALKFWLEANAEELGVSPEALFWQFVSNGKLRKADKPEALDAPLMCSPQEKPKPFSKRFILMLNTAIENGNVSVRKILTLLQFDLEDLEQVFEAHGMPAPFAI
jgi:Zn-dependent peptidase ImmA (M78 family)/transcriptional regulator with XRE-family HTH domain